MVHADLPQRLRLYVVIDPEWTRHDPLALLCACIEGGATAIQLRAKSITDRELLDLATRMRELTAEPAVLFVVNDRIDIAMAAGADGVHLGVDDLPLDAARRLGGPRMVVGYSPDTDEQSASARIAGASYLGIGPVFGTASKSDAGAAIGLETLRRRHAVGRLPSVGIGGISVENAADVISAGASGVAVMGAIGQSENPTATTRQIGEAIHQATGRTAR
jgi:thiamine-phosphate diphosphorylase